jgi:hypothetical protein
VTSIIERCKSEKVCEVTMKKDQKKEILEAMENKVILDQKQDPPTYISNQSGYGYKGSENFEHDDTGSVHNASGVEDIIVNAMSDHEGYEEGYDY